MNTRRDSVTKSMIGSMIAFWEAAKRGLPVESMPLVLEQAVRHSDEFFCLACRIGGFERGNQGDCNNTDLQIWRRRKKEVAPLFKRVVGELIVLKNRGEADTALFVTLAFAQDPQPLINMAYRYAEEIE